MMTNNTNTIISDILKIVFLVVFLPVGLVYMLYRLRIFIKPTVRVIREISTIHERQMLIEKYIRENKKR